MILGYITAGLFLLTAAKFVTKRLHNKKLDDICLKIHKLSGTALIAVTLIHLAIVWKLIHQRPVSMYIFGFALLFFMLLAALSHVFRKKVGWKWLKLHRAASILVCICLVVHIVLGVTSFFVYQRIIASITYKDISISQVADGYYEGEFDAGYICARVCVTVEEGKIVSIELLEHRNERGKPAERIISDILSEQTFEVDAVSGATNSSKVIKKAIDNALEQGRY